MLDGGRDGHDGAICRAESPESRLMVAGRQSPQQLTRGGAPLHLNPATAQPGSAAAAGAAI